MRDFGKDLKRIIHADGEHVRTRARGCGNIQLEGQVAALMLPDFDVIQPDFGEVIHRAETKEDDASLLEPFRGNVDFTLIPCGANVITKACIGLPGRRDSDMCCMLLVKR